MAGDGANEVDIGINLATLMKRYENRNIKVIADRQVGGCHEPP